MYFFKRHTGHEDKIQEFQCTKHLYNTLTEAGGHFSLPMIVVPLRQLCKHNLLFT